MRNPEPNYKGLMLLKAKIKDFNFDITVITRKLWNSKTTLKSI